MNRFLRKLMEKKQKQANTRKKLNKNRVFD